MLSGDYHVKDIIRAPGDKLGQGKAVDRRPAAGWLTLLKEQLGVSGKR